MGFAVVLLIIIGGRRSSSAVGMYNGLVTLRNRCDNAWSQVDVQLRRRYDLIPNLVETVKGYAKHESGVFEKRDPGPDPGHGRRDAQGSRPGRERPDRAP